MRKSSRIAKNTTMLMLMNGAKVLFPLMTLPYLTRVLSTDCYGIVAYVKAVMSYMQIVVDFGFILSATKRVAEAENNKQISEIIGDIIVSKIMLGVLTGVVLLIICFNTPILKKNLTFTLLSYIVIFLTIFLLDFLFRGIEKMQIITVRFVIMRGISTALTFVFVKSDKDLLWIPVLDIIGSVIAIIWVMYEVRKLGIEICFSGIKRSWLYLKESFVYFLSSMASTSFNVLNTIILGNVLTTTEIAYWSVCMQIISAVQMLYTPISDAIYPEMIKEKDISVIRKVLSIFTPILIVGCVVAFIFGKTILYLVGGLKYIEAVTVLRVLIPVVFFGFLSILFGWPTLGAIGKVKETTWSTVLSVLFQIVLMLILWKIEKLTLMSFAIIRSLTEIVLFTTRFYFFQIYRSEFNGGVTV